MCKVPLVRCAYPDPVLLSNNPYTRLRIDVLPESSDNGITLYSRLSIYFVKCSRLNFNERDTP